MCSSVSATKSSQEISIATLATALEQVVARVTQELDPDVGEGVGIEDPAWARVHSELVAIARECAKVLDDPTVVDALLTSQAFCSHSADFVRSTESAS